MSGGVVRGRASPDLEYLIVATAGESLGEVRAQLDTVDVVTYARLQRVAQNDVRAVFAGIPYSAWETQAPADTEANISSQPAL